ncbi:hypothetical protein CONPUDRAFT_120116 [Coniophora puteana RWD-64-598 SS2]|uniref:DNA2/NAM7 helicase-like C-terminal domain-containing protein n=1 Tax=Coniophora puteana (strain RWD-64-598) TaxID=741705 RepID=A0A5M3N0C2_CONPW|nr:uncharacterized protein CONPUDRAFT_120116 [Coniophora puteana RWD-64-598 SS2]EIW84341.1 hypothetical protein CONPUDRAFT_120116 [Coniophora puteana RWD-64-598 SS2]
MSITSSPDDSARTLWIGAQSNVAVKNIAEKLVSLKFHQFKILVSKDFHYDWHEHLYEEIEKHVIRSDRFNKDLTMTSGTLIGVRVILCTLSMFSNDKLSELMRMVPVQTIIFDEASQIEVGDYLSILHRFRRTLEKLVFIGDDKQYRMPTIIGGFISKQMYKGKLKSKHKITDSSACFFVDVNGDETTMGHSWMNEKENATVVRLARFFNEKKQSYRIVTPYDGQRSLIEKTLKSAKIPWENKCFNVDAFQGNEDDHIIISLVRTKKIGFLKNVRRTNVMLSRCKRSMVICTNRPFISETARDTLPGKLARSLGQDNWLNEKDILNGRMGALTSILI